MGSIAGGVGTSWLWPWHIHPHQKRQTNTRSLLYTRKLLVFFSPFFLTIERPVLVMVCLFPTLRKEWRPYCLYKACKVQEKVTQSIDGSWSIQFDWRKFCSRSKPLELTHADRKTVVRVMVILIKYLWRCSSSEDTKVSVMFCGADAVSQYPKRTTVLPYICILFSCLWRTASVRIDTGAVEKTFGHLCNRQ